MKRRMISALLAGALCTGTAIVPAGAVHVTDIAGLGVMAAVSAVSSALESDGVHTTLPVLDGQAVGFGGLEKRVLENNATIKVLEKQLAGIGNTDIDAQFDAQEFSTRNSIANYQNQLNAAQTSITELREQIATETDPDREAQLQKQLAAAQASLIAAQSGLGVAQGTLDSIDDAREAAQQQLDDQYASMEKQIENIGQSLSVAAQNVYLGLVTLQEGLDTLDRNLASLDRNIQVVEKQVEIGMAAELTLANLEQSRRSLASQRETLVVQQEQAENQLAMLCGGGPDSRLYITGVPQVTSAQLREMDYDADLEQALDNSYLIWQKEDALRQASNDYEDDVTSSLDYYEAAKLDLESEKDTVTSTFRQLYTDVQDKKRLLDEAQAAYENEQRNFAVDELQYERGMISKIDYLTAQDDLAAQEDAVRTAEHDLFSAYNTYDWAKRGYMAGA